VSETLSAEELAEGWAQQGPLWLSSCDPSRLFATIEALQAEVTTLRTALEEASGLFNEMHLPLQGHAATRCTLRTDFCVTAEHVREARRNADC